MDNAALELMRERWGALPRGRRHLVGITGPPGSGKSTLAEALAASFGQRAALVPMDGFHLADEELRRLGRLARKGAPDTFDVGGYRALLGRLRTASEVVYAPRFDRVAEAAIAGSIAVRPDVDLVLTEGNYLVHDGGGWEAVAAHLDEVVYLDVMEPVLEERLIARRLAHGHDCEAAADWVRRVDLPNARLVAHGRERAGLVLPGQD